MATDSVLNLFMDPYQLEQQRSAAVNQRAAQFAQLDPMAQAQYGIYRGASNLGTGIGGLLGAEDPQMKLAALRKQLAQGKDLTTSEGWAQYTQELQQAGDMQGAAQAAQRATELQAKIDEKQAAREQALMIARERNKSAEQIAADRNAITAQIAQMNAALRGANSDVQRQLIEQRIQDLQVKAQEKQQTLQSQAQGRVAAFDSAIDTLDIVSRHPGKKAVVGALSGGIVSAIPGTDAAGFASQLETFKAQTFIPMVSALKGMGALSDAEGKKLTAAVGALDIKMKPAEFDAAVARIKADLEAARARASSLPGMSTVPPVGADQGGWSIKRK